MTYTVEELRELLDSAERMPFGVARTAVVERVVRYADALEDPDLRYDARMAATEAYHHGGEPAKGLATFSWCLAEYDREPGRRSRVDEYLLLWSFKYAVSSLTRFPEVPLARAVAVLDDMRRRYAESGHSQHAVYAQQWGLAFHIGHQAEADEWFERWCAAPRDELSDCVGCDPTSKVEHLVSVGEYERAIELAEPVLAGRLTCREQPQLMLTGLLYPYLLTGRNSEAVEAHRRGYRLIRGNLADLDAIAEHIRFCTLTGNTGRGLEIVERHLGWLETAPSPYAAMEFATCSAALLNAVVRAGHGEATVHRRGSGDRQAHQVAVGDLAAELASRARDLAARFDRRNGTDHQGQRVEGRLATVPIMDQLPLDALAAALHRQVTGRTAGGTAGTGGSAGADQAGTTGVAGSGHGAAQGAATTVGDPDLASRLPEDPEALLDAAERWNRMHEQELAAMAWAKFDQADVEQSPYLLARRLDARGIQQAVAGQVEEAEATWNEAAQAYRQLGDEVRELAARGRVGTLIVGVDGRSAEGLALVEETTASLAGCPDPLRRVGARMRLSAALLATGRHLEALESVDLARAIVETEVAAGDAEVGIEAGAEADAGSGVEVGVEAVAGSVVEVGVEAGLEANVEVIDPLLAAEVSSRRANCLLVLERFGEAADSARAAIAFYTAAGRVAGLGVPPVTAVAHIALGQALVSLGHFDEAVEAFGTALSCANDPGLRLAARTARGRSLQVADRPAEAVDDLVEAVADRIARGDAVAAVYLQHELAMAYSAAGQLLNAAETAEQVISGLDGLGDQEGADRARYLLASVYRQLGELDSALVLLDELAVNLDGFDNLPVRGQMREEAALILYRCDRDREAATRFTQAAEAFAAAELVFDELRNRRMTAVALRWAGQPEPAMLALETAERLITKLPPDEPATMWEQAMLDYDAARVYAGFERLPEALDRVTDVAARFRSIDAFGEALVAELLRGELLLRCGQPEQASRCLRQVLSDAPVGSQPRTNAAWLLCQAMEALGEVAEADALRKEYGLEDS